MRLCTDSVTVSGNACANGAEYGRQEALEPLRPLLTTVATDTPLKPRLAVRSERDFPLARVLEAMEVLDGITAHAPLRTGDVLVENMLGTGIRIIARADLPITSGC